jgi:hypothetical protein
MKIYVACHSLERGKQVAEVLELKGHEIVSRWLNEPFNKTGTYSLSERHRIASMDADDVSSCDCLVLVSGPDKYSGGKFVEAGIAMGLGKRVVVLGFRENMLLYHPGIQEIEQISEFEPSLT